MLDFCRCAMLPLRDAAGRSGREDSFEEIAAELDGAALRRPFAGWRLDALPRALGAGAGTSDTAGSAGDDDGPPVAIAPGTRWRVDGGDVVSSAPELARLTLNVAAVHHDRAGQRDGRRLVYGGHTIGIAAAQATRSLPRIATFVGWHSCDHLAPVHEGDTLRSRARARGARAARARRRAAAPALARARLARARRRRRGRTRRRGARLALRRARRLTPPAPGHEARTPAGAVWRRGASSPWTRSACRAGRRSSNPSRSCRARRPVRCRRPRFAACFRCTFRRPC